ncbi:MULTISPECIES: FGGY-family carbohydrate kinase [Streptomyces]|uniref:Sugar kinase n=1 Tax=Streptomyces dengpaensis TaxID=2049881 RepID=A0ABN5HWG0_9ACTN|nr:MULTISPECIES: FGGY family carbohydrate kinase [Streptomyces]AVH55003.1 sugar kinase [Streptomyces dengpaensis]PIB08298.1 sugar kinase [Streptomyces sp. HG99]
MTRYFIGIDNGSQSSKVSVFDEHGHVVSVARRALRPYDTPRPGVVEHPDDDLWTSIGAAAGEAMAAFPGDPADIVGVGLCTIRFCRAVLKADGTLAQPVMSWMDARVSRPYERETPDAAYVTTSSGYITHRMTGQFRDTAANYAGMWPLDSDTFDWKTDDAGIAELGLDRSMLFDLVQPGAILGTVTEAAAAHTGIPAGLPVVATANDKAVEALGCGLRSDDTLLVSLGTYVAGMTTGSRNVTDSADFWTNYAATPHAYLYESYGVRRGMWTVSWYRDLLGEEAAGPAREAGISPEEYINRQAALVPPGSDGLITVLDWLAPTEAPHRKGSILGFDGRQGRFHIYRSILEGLALTIGETAGKMAAELGTDFKEVIVSGGGSASDVMMQIFADVFGVPARRSAVADAAGLGSVITAAVATGTYPDFDTAIDAMVRPGETFTPAPAEHALYTKLQKIHSEARRHTDGIYVESYELFG